MSTSKLRSMFVRAASVFATISVLGSLIPATADIIGPGIRITAITSSGATSQLEFPIAWDPAGGRASWSMTDEYYMYDYSLNPPRVIATLNPAEEQTSRRQCSVEYYADPVVNLSFSVQANPIDATTTFMISSALLGFAPINPAIGRASAGFSVTDANTENNLAGAQLTGIGTNAVTGGGYLAQYNGFAGTLSGTTFAEMFHQINVAPDDTTTVSQNVPPILYNPIAGAVSNMSALVSFTLTRGDLASGTSNYEIIPEPASAGLLLLGAAALLRRRS